MKRSTKVRHSMTQLIPMLNDLAVVTIYTYCENVLKKIFKKVCDRNRGIGIVWIQQTQIYEQEQMNAKGCNVLYSWQSCILFLMIVFEVSTKFNILLLITYVLRVSKKRLKQSFLNDINTINIIKLICYLCKTLIVNALQRVLSEKIKFSILNGKIDKFALWKSAQFLLSNGRAITKIIA